MNEYINLTKENIEREHICCAIRDSKHQTGVKNKKIKNTSFICIKYYTNLN